MTTLIVVRRDATATFQHFEATFGHTLGRDLVLIWDRRTNDRRRRAESVLVERRGEDRREPESDPGFLDQRQVERRQQPEARPLERRQAERRRRLMDTWGTLAFVIAREDRIVVPGAG